MDGLNIGKILFNLQHPMLLFKRLNNVQQNDMQNSNTFANTTNNLNQNTQILRPGNQNTQQPLTNNTEQTPQTILPNTKNPSQINTNTVNQNPQPVLQNNQNVQQVNTNASAEKIAAKADTTNTHISQQTNNNIKTSPQNIETVTKQIQEINFQSADKSVFVKTLLGLPQNLGQALLMVQNPNNSLIGGTLGLTNVNQNLLQPSTVLANLFNEGTPTAQPNVTRDVMAQVVSNIQQNVTQQQLQQNNNILFFSGMISMPEVAKLILQNSKQAVAALIIAMASTSKQGIGNNHIQETLSIINSCIAMAESDNPAMTLKSLMMLYIPWLPLNDGVGFDMEISQQSGENDSNDSKLTVLIQTKNYGNIKGVFTLTTTNSVDAYIICTDSFPKQELQDYLNKESSSHAMNTNIDIEDIKPQTEEINEVQETKVNLSATNEMNPYLLLIAHAFIRGTVAIDNNLSELTV